MSPELVIPEYPKVPDWEDKNNLVWTVLGAIFAIFWWPVEAYLAWEMGR